jgi:hypothetical protein
MRTTLGQQPSTQKRSGGHWLFLLARANLDIGFGDAITPEANVVDFPAPLDFPAPRLRAYPRETVVAEKVEAMVQLGLANSRMKDFYDLVILSRMFPFGGEAVGIRKLLPIKSGMVCTDNASARHAKRQSFGEHFLLKKALRSSAISGAGRGLPERN